MHFLSVRFALAFSLARIRSGPRSRATTRPSAREPSCSTEGDRLADEGQFTEAVIRYKRAMEEAPARAAQDPVQARGQARRDQT